MGNFLEITVKRRAFIALTASAILSACTSSETSPANPSGEGTPVYLISEKQADDIMRKAMATTFTNLPIMKVDVPHPGYTVSMNFALDQHSITLMMVPTKGVFDGKVMDGYSFKVAQYGSIPITGGIRTRNIIREIEKMTSNVKSTSAISSAQTTTG